MLWKAILRTAVQRPHLGSPSEGSFRPGFISCVPCAGGPAPASGILSASSCALAAEAQERVLCMKSSVTDTAQADGACIVVRFGAPRPLQLLGALPPQWHLCAAGA